MRTNVWKVLLGSLAIGAMTASGSGCATSVDTDGGGGGGGDEPTSTTTTSTTTTTTSTTTTTTTSTTTSSSSGGGEGGAGGAGGGGAGGGGGGALEGDQCADAIEIVDGLTLTGTDFTQYANDYAFTDPSCASFNFAYQRPDVVFVRDLQAGDTVQITEHGTLDVIMHAVSGSCGAAACAGSISDQTAAQQQSTGLIYTATQAETVYFFVESLYGLPNESVVDITTQTFDIRFDLVSCGDGTVSAATEGCDDGNTVSGDGCSATCTVETGYLCTGAPSVCTEFPSCASPIVVTDDFTFAGANIYGFPDNHDFTGSSCSGASSSNASTRPDVAFEVQLAAGDSVTVTEQGNVDALIHLQTGVCGATTNCTSSTDSDTTGVTYTASTAESVYVFLEPWSASSTLSAYDLRFDFIRCGDGMREGTEGCDDGNKIAGDGCSASCTVENGFICNQASPSVCGPVPAADCSAPIVASDGFNYVGNNIANFGHAYFYSGAGCVNQTGTLQRPEIVFSVDLVAGQRLTVTEHGTLDTMLHLQTGSCGGTTCQASTDTDLTGVNYTATGTETVYVVVESVAAAPSAASTFDVRFDITQCGDGVREGTEACDDGNMDFDDGCSSSCQVEAGWYCYGAPSVCEILPAADCSDPVIAGNGLQFTGTNILSFGSNYSFGGTGCTGGSSTTRPEIVFAVDLLAGSTLKVTEHTALDALIHIQTGACGSTNACVASIDFGEDTTGAVFQSLADQTVYVFVEPYSGTTTTTLYDIRFQVFQCGDGVVGGSETCDDGNMTAGDGCSATCTVESGFICAGNPSTCGPEANWGQIALAGCTGTIVTTAAMGVPAAIPDNNSTGVTLNIPVTAMGTVQGAALRFNATHTWVSEVGAFLRNPAGAPSAAGLTLTSGNGGSSDNFVNTIFSDAAAVAITAGTAPFTGLFRPQSPLSVFNGTAANGTWTLKVSDSGSGDTGTVQSAELALCVVP